MKSRFSGSWFIVGFILFLLAIININRLLPYPQAKDLLIDMAPYISNWKVRGDETQSIPQGPLGGRQTIHTATITYESLEGSISQDIYQFNSCSDSGKYYSQEVAGLLTKQKPNEMWIALPEIRYDSTVARNAYFSCEQTTFATPMTGCSYIAQYGAYVVVVYGGWYIDSQVNQTNLREILKAIDKKMSAWYGICIP